MKEHIKRKINIKREALPEQGTKEYEDISSFYKKQRENNPKLKKELERQFLKARNTLLIQDSNGINLTMDKEIRYFLGAFNIRAWELGLLNLPMSFNILESFFNYRKSLVYFELLEEEDCLFSFFDFFTFYTKTIENKDIFIKDYLEENIIYHYNVGSDMNEIIFKSNDNKNNFIIGGISLVRRKNEVTLLLQIGEEDNNEKLSKGTTKIFKKNLNDLVKTFPEMKNEWVYLEKNSSYIKNLLACRIDIKTKTMDARYLLIDMNDSFQVLSDDIYGYIKGNGQFIDETHKDLYVNSCKKIENYSALFEVAKASLYLPYYFDYYDEKIIQEEHQTKYYTMARSPKLKRQYKNVNSELKLTSRTLFILNTDDKFASDRIHIRDDKFKIETNGYWKQLSPTEIGMDKKGNQITGKTWVNRKESYYQASTDELIIERKKENIFIGENAGYIYVMRNPYLPSNTYKIGLTTKTTSERAKQLSKTSVPDKFKVMREWNVADCYQAEKEIHLILDKYRIDPRREFFELDMKEINIVIEKVIKKINDEFLSKEKKENE